MQKWRMSFSLSKSTKHLKKHWMDYFQVYGNESVWSVQRQKAMSLFLDVLDTYKEQPIAELLDELLQHFIEVFTHCLACCLDLNKRNKNDLLASEEDFDMFHKLLHVVELLTSESKSLAVLAKHIEENHNPVKLILDVLHNTHDVSTVAALLHILKNLIVSVKLVTRVMDEDCISVLVTITNHFDDVALLQQSMLLLTSIIGNYRFNSSGSDQLRADIQFNNENSFDQSQRTRTYSTSSAGSFLGKTSLPNKQTRRQSKSSLGLINETSSIPATPQSNTNIAWNVFSEIIKMTPLSAAWMSNDPKMGLDDQRKDAFFNEDFNPSLSTSIVLSPMEIASEQQSIKSYENEGKNDQDIDTTTTIRLERMHEDSIEAQKNILLFQHFHSVFETAIQKATTPSDAINALNFLTVVAVGNPSFQGYFRTEILLHISEMFERIENNLTLLTPCRDTTRAVATSSGPNNNIPSSSSSISSHNTTLPSEPTGQTHNQVNNAQHPTSSQFHSFAGNEFDDYYAHVMGILLQLLLDEISIEKIVIAMAQQNPGMTTAPMASTPVKMKSYALMKLIKLFLISPRVTLFSMGLKMLYFLIRIHPLHMIIISHYGLIEILFHRLYGIIHYGRIDYEGYTVLLSSFQAEIISNMKSMKGLKGGIVDDKIRSVSDTNASTTSNGTSSAFFHQGHNNLNIIISRDSSIETDLNTMDHSSNRPMLSSSSHSRFAPHQHQHSSLPSYRSFAVLLADEILFVLQSLSVGLYQQGDPLIPNTLSLLFLSVWMPMGHGYPDKFTKYTKKCMNCELEIATRECVHESCIRDKCFRLCEECDLVFHKSAMKKRHIRIPTLIDRSMYKHTSATSSSSSLASTGSSSATESSNLHSQTIPSTSTNDDIEIFDWKKVNELLSASSKNFLLQTIIMNCEDSFLLSRQHRNNSEVIYWKELISSVMGIYLRSMLDDQKARGISLPMTMLTNVSFALRYAMFVSSSTAVSTSTIELEQALHKVLSRYPDIDVNRSLDPSCGPPEIYYTHTKRIFFGLTVQLLARFLVLNDSKDDKQNLEADVLNIMPSSFGGIYPVKEITTQSKKCACNALQIINTIGLFPALHYFAIDDTTFIPLNLMDRQYLLWMFRESCITAITVQYPGLQMMLEWFSWLLMPNSFVPPKTMKPDVKTNHGGKESSSTTTMTKNISFNDFLHLHKNQEKFYFAWLPLGFSNISPTIKLLVIQELRMLISSCGHYPPSPIFNTVHSIDQLFKPLDGTQSTLIDFSQNRNVINSSNRNHVSNRYSVSNIIGPEYTTCTGSLSLKKILVMTGFVQILFALIFEDRYWRHVKASLGQGNAHTKIDNTITEIDRECWWSCIVLLGELIAGCEDAKEIIDRDYGLCNVSKWILQIVEFLQEEASSSSGANTTNNGTNCELALSKLLTELCLQGHRILPAKNPFAAFSFSFPKSSISQFPSKSTNFHQSSPPHFHHTYHHTSSYPQRFPEKPSTPTQNTNISFHSNTMKLYSSLSASSSSSSSSSLSSTVHLSPYSLAVMNLDLEEITSLSNIYYTFEPFSSWINSSFHDRFVLMENNPFQGDYDDINHYLVIRNFSFLPLTLSPILLGEHTHKPTSARRSREESFDAIPSPASLSTDMLHLPRPRSSKIHLNLSSISLQTADNNSSMHDMKWESESVGKVSVSHEMASRSSMNSHQSITAIMQAMKSTPVHLILQEEDSSPRPNNLSIHNYPHITSFTKDPLVDTPASTMDIKFFPAKDNLLRHDTLHVEYPFPSFDMTQNCGEKSLWYCSLLHRMHNLGFVPFHKSLVLLHHCLLVRSGLHTWLGGDESTADDVDAVGLGLGLGMIEGEVDISSGKFNIQSNDILNVDRVNNLASNANTMDMGMWNLLKTVDGYYFMLKKHLSMYMEPVSDNSNPQSLPYPLPPKVYTNLQLRNSLCFDVLLSFATVSSGRVQCFVLETLYTIIDANPANAFQLSNNPAHCLMLSACLMSQSSRIQDLSGSILSLILSYSANVSCLKYIFSSIITKKSEVALLPSVSNSQSQNISSDAAMTNFALYVLGKACELDRPKYFLFFDLANSLFPKFTLPAVTHPSPIQSQLSQSVPASNVQWNISTWIRLGEFGSSPIMSLFYLEHPESGLGIHVYFRNLYVRDKEAASSSTDEPTESTLPRQSGQLCISFTRLPTSGCGIPPAPPLSPFRQMNPSVDRSTIVSCMTASSSDVALCWQAAMNFFLDLEGDQYEYDSQQADKQIRLFPLLEVMTNLAFPDVIIDYSWSELSEWHLLHLQFWKEQVACFVDGNEFPVWYFTPFGYAKHCPANTSFNLFKDERKTSIAKFTEVISKEKPMLVHFGGLPILSTIPTDEQLDCEHIKRLHSALSQTIIGFCGFVSDIVLFEGEYEFEQLLSCVREGPQNGLKRFHSSSKVLSSLYQSDISRYAEHQKTTSSKFSGHAIASATAAVQRITLSDIHFSMKDMKNVQVFYCQQPITKADDIFSVELSSNSQALQHLVQVHRQEALFVSYKQLGGLKLFYPLLQRDVSVVVATLRILSGLIFHEETYQHEYKHESMDKVMFYTLSKSYLQVPEVSEVLFDMIVRSHSTMVYRIAKPPLDLTDKFTRFEILSTLVDITVGAFRNYAFCRTVLDWLRTMCENVKDNIPKLVKAVGLSPIMILLSIWTIGNAGEIEFISKERSGSLNGGKTTSQGPTETDRRKVSFIEQLETLYSGKPETVANVNGGIDESNVVGAASIVAIKPIDPSNRISIGKSLANQLEQRQEKAEDWMGMYRLQLAGLKLIRVLIYGTCNDAHVIDSLKYMQSGNIDSFATTFTPLLSFVIAAARPKLELAEHDTNKTSSKFNDQYRRSEKLKITIRHNFTLMPILKNVDLGDNRYWSMSSALIVLNEILKLVDGDSLSAAFVLPIKNSLLVYNLGNVALDLMASPAVELREAALRLLGFHFTGIDGKLDSKIIALFEKQHGFQFMAQQLTLHTGDCCDELILDRLLALLFWQSSISLGSNDIVSVESSNMENSNVKLSSSPTTNPTIPSSYRAGGNTVHGENTLNKRKELVIPQLLEVLFRVLAFARHYEHINHAFQVLLDCIGGIEVAHGHANHSSTGSHALPSHHHPSHHQHHASHSHNSRHPIECMDEVAMKNMEHVYQQKDWILWLGDLINHYQRQSHQYATLQPNSSNNHDYGDAGNAGAGSMSESESVTNTNPYSVTSGSATGLGASGYNNQPYSRHDSFFSEENNSAFDESVGSTSEENGGLQIVPSSSSTPTTPFPQQTFASSVQPNSTIDPMLLQQRYLRQYTATIYQFVVHLFTYDFIQKYHPIQRKWIEFFRLSLPEHSYVQEEILHALLDSMIRCSFLSISTTASSSSPPASSNSNDVNTEYGLNYLKNIGYFLEQVLERNKLHVKLCLSILQTLHNLTYYCSIELRNKFPKETNLPEIRKQLLTRCLMEVGQDLHIRIYAYDKLQTSIAAYLTNTNGTDTTKLIPDSSIVILFCGMFVECFEDLECLVGCSTNTMVNSTLGINGGELVNSFDEYTHTFLASSPSIQGQRSSEVNQSIRNNIAMMQTIISLIQTCVESSIECKKTMTKLIEGISSEYIIPLSTILLLRPLSNTNINNTIVISSTPSSSSNILGDVTPAIITTSSSIPATTANTSTSLSSWWYWGTSSSTNTVNTNNNTSLANATSSNATPGLFNTRSNSINYEDLERGSSSVANVEDKETTSPGSVSPATSSAFNYPTDIKSFIYWYCSSQRRELQQELRNRILRDLRPVLRQAEKLRERHSQRILKFSKTLQDKRTKDKSVMGRIVQDLNTVITTYHEKMKTQSIKEIQGCVKAMKDRYNLGYDLFHGMEVTHSNTNKVTLASLRSPSTTVTPSSSTAIQHTAPLVVSTIQSWQQEFEVIQLPDTIKLLLQVDPPYSNTLHHATADSVHRAIAEEEHSSQYSASNLISKGSRPDSFQALIDHLDHMHKHLDRNNSNQ